jgi:glycosyltransferase involved in cell wall biosynthesis
VLSAGLTHVTTVADSLDFFRGQVEYMKARGFVVRAMTSPGPDLARFARELDLEIDGVPMARKITPVADVVAIAAMRCLLRRHQPAIVHAHTPKGGLLGLAAACAAGTPVRIYHMRGLPFTTATGWTRSLLRRTERLSCRLAHQVFAVSESVRAHAVAAHLCEPSKIRVLGRGSGNGVDAARRFDPHAVGAHGRRATRGRLGIPDDALVVGFVGRIVRDKGVDDLVQAWRAIRASHPAAHLLVIGPFEPRDAVARDTELALRGDPRVHVVGTVLDMPPWYAAMDVVVLPTHREGFPNVVLEAAAMRLPVVATRVTGCVDAVEDGRTGVLVPPCDAAALARGILTYLASPTLRRDHGSAGRARVLVDFRPEGIWHALYLEYRRLLEQAGLAGDGVPAPERWPRAPSLWSSRVDPGGRR